MTRPESQPRHPLEPEQRIALIQPHLPEGVTVEVETGDHQDAWVSANTARHTLLNLEGDVDEAGTDILWHVIESQARAIAALRAQAEADQDLREVARTLHMYSRRYCDGRSTYAPDDHNRATHTLLRLGVVLDADPISKTGPFAADGMYGLTEREHAALAQAGGEL